MGRNRSLISLLALALAPVLAPACSTSKGAPAPSPSVRPLTAVELGIRARLGVPADARTVLVFGQNAHLDIDWQKTFDDYYTTFVGQVLTEARQILQTQPRAFYSVAEMAFLEHHLAVHPEELGPLKDASHAGALHVVGGGMTSPDTLLPETELLLRDYLYGIRFAEDTLDAHPTAAWLPDSFGHAATAPDVLAAAGFTSVAFARVDGAPGLFDQITHNDPPPLAGSTAALLLQLGSADFVWNGPGGGSVIAHFMASPGLYCAGDNIDYAEGLEVAGGHVGDFKGDDTTFTDGQIDGYAQAMAPYTKTPYVFIPVGCDFASPKPQLISYLDGYNQRRFPTTGVWAVAAPFDTYAELLAGWHDVLPAMAVDLTPYYMGFYGSRAAVKRGARDAARPFFVAETYATALGAQGTAAVQAASAQLELLTRANHHDFVPGTSTDDVVANEEMPLLAAAQAAGQAELAQVAGAIAARIPVQAGATARMLALNPSGLARSDVAELQIPIQGGVVPPLHALADGQPVPMEVVGTPLPTDTTATLRLALGAMPPFSWRAVDLLPGAAAVTPAVTLQLLDSMGAPATGADVAKVVLANENVQATWAQGDRAASRSPRCSSAARRRSPATPASSTTTPTWAACGASATRWTAAR